MSAPFLLDQSEGTRSCHSDADLIGEESASASKTADSSRDTTALRNDNLMG
jgi:hypothetical protein